MAQQGAVAADDYTVRLAQSEDREPFLSLYEEVWGRSRSEQWFDWRFVDDPYAGAVEMVVAEHDETLVGAEPLLPMPLVVGGEPVDARQPVDWIVHPDHRRRGVFTRMTETLLSAFEDRAELLFNFPTEALRPGLEKFDWTTVSEQTTRYRIHDPDCLTAGGEGPSSTVRELLCRVGAPVVRGSVGAIDLLTPSPGGVSVERVDGVATDAIHTVYADTRPEAIHVPREPAFVDWRFANPRWETATYVARREGAPVATLVVATASKPDATVGYLLDIQPMTTDPERAPAFAAALDAALADLDVDAVQAPTTPYPAVLRRRGFLCDDNAVLSRFSTPATHVVRPLPEPDADGFARDVFDDEEWLLTLGDRDIE
ncbi:hypothetical protein HALDL1_16375 [Halobacterium sp. DL1]|jgi:hypothetical protein|nr:hypothetical protein HALDL1_16375 [Halobacterium sp. DL1]